MLISRRRFAAAAAVLAILGSSRASLADTPEARRVVESFHATLLEVMKSADKLGFDGRVRELKPAVESVFDLTTMARLSVGMQWQSFTPDQQQQIIKLFRDYSVATYASRFDGYEGEEFKTEGEKPQQGGRVVVETEMVVKTGDPVRLAYLMAQNQGKWQVFDVFANGTISQLAVLRAEFTAVLKRDGVAGLLQTLARKIDELRSKA